MRSAMGNSYKNRIRKDNFLRDLRGWDAKSEKKSSMPEALLRPTQEQQQPPPPPQSKILYGFIRPLYF